MSDTVTLPIKTAPPSVDRLMALSMARTTLRTAEEEERAARRNLQTVVDELVRMEEDLKRGKSVAETITEALAQATARRVDAERIYRQLSEPVSAEMELAARSREKTEPERSGEADSED